MYKKAWCTCKIVVLLIKPIAFVAFPLPSPSSDLKVPYITTAPPPNLTRLLHNTASYAGYATVHTLTCYLEYNWFSQYWQKAKKQKGQWLACSLACKWLKWVYTTVDEKGVLHLGTLWPLVTKQPEGRIKEGTKVCLCCCTERKNKNKKNRAE